MRRRGPASERGVAVPKAPRARAAAGGVLFDNARADPTRSFTYDRVYRLVEATGREHDGLAQPSAAGFAPIAPREDTEAQRNYVQSYT